MLDVTITELRANLLRYLRIAQKGEQINITSRGTVLATLSSPANRETDAKARLKVLSKTAKIEDVVSPLETDWNSLK
ncbi:MAG: type II toxin-antitoxin system prevent-host-death family antitoxin [Pyrinomonadaceae bacterium]